LSRLPDRSCRTLEWANVFPAISVLTLGRTVYRDALALQRRLHAARAAGEIGDILLLTEHEPVLTLGRRADGRYLCVSPDVLAERGIELVPTERGGDITYHGPGQLVAYPILDLRRRAGGVRRYVWELEESAVRLLARYGLRGERRPGTPGVWAGDGKIASLGVYVARGITMHGIAINLAPNPADFDLIHPCGLVDTHLTSVALLTTATPPIDTAFAAYACEFAATFAVEVRRAAPPQIASIPERDPMPGIAPEHG